MLFFNLPNIFKEFIAQKSLCNKFILQTITNHAYLLTLCTRHFYSIKCYQHCKHIYKHTYQHSVDNYKSKISIALIIKQLITNSSVDKL